MVDGIADILSQIKNVANRKQIAKNMINDFEKENVSFDYNNFLKAIELDRLKNGGGIDLNEQFIVGNYQGGGVMDDMVYINGAWYDKTIMQNGGLTPKKAREILHDGTVHGKPITEQQRKYFGYISSKKQDGGAVTMTGYRQDSPDVNNAFNFIPSSDITMDNVVGDVRAVDRLGNVTTMTPENNYKFPYGGVLEYRPKKGKVKFSM
jgi:hypothetical protein